MENTLTPGASINTLLSSLTHQTGDAVPGNLSSITTSGATSLNGFGLGTNTLNAIHQWYPEYYTHWCSHPDTFKQAFKITQKLMEKKLVKKIVTIDDFVQLVNEIQTILEKRN